MMTKPVKVKSVKVEMKDFIVHYETRGFFFGGGEGGGGMGKYTPLL